MDCAHYFRECRSKAAHSTIKLVSGAGLVQAKTDYITSKGIVYWLKNRSLFFYVSLQKALCIEPRISQKFGSITRAAPFSDEGRSEGVHFLQLERPREEAPVFQRGA